MSFNNQRDSLPNTRLSTGRYHKTQKEDDELALWYSEGCIFLILLLFFLFPFLSKKHISSMNRHLKRDILRLLALTVGLLLMVVFLSGCRPTQIITDNNTETHDTIIQIRHSRDSIFVRDSILVKTANDTVFVDRWHERYRYLTKRDTIYQTRDSIQYEVITKTVTEYKTPWWCRGGLLLLLLGLVAFLLLLLVKK